MCTLVHCSFSLWQFISSCYHSLLSYITISILFFHLWSWTISFQSSSWPHDTAVRPLQKATCPIKENCPLVISIVTIGKSDAAMDNPISSIYVKVPLTMFCQWSYHAYPLTVLDYSLLTIYGPSMHQHPAWPSLSKYPWMPEFTVPYFCGNLYWKDASRN